MQPNVGPWKSNPPWTRLCGGCKIQLTLATPGVKEQLTADAKAAGASLGVNVSEVVFDIPSDEGGN
jgi:hypothetical protein